MRAISGGPRARRRRPLVIERGAQQRRHKPDYWLLIYSVILLAIGLIVIYAISPGLSITSRVPQNYYINRQMISVFLGVVAFAITCSLPVGTWRRLQRPLLVLAAISAIAVRLFGQEINGAYRWIQIGGFSFQSNELIKFAILIWVAGFLADKIKSGTVTDNKLPLRPLLICLAVVVIVVAGIQSDLGSTAVIVGIMATMVFVAGLPLKRIMTTGGIIIVAGILLVSVSGYKKQRLETFLHPDANCQSTGYQACQALIAVGSGGMIGLGLGRDVQSYGYLPEAQNDSIFAIYAEKFGLIGSLVLLALFLGLFIRLKNIIEHAPDDFSRLVVSGVLAWLCVQAFINIAAMVGIIPFEGITLPFISYGGTSILFVTAAIGVAFQISRYTTYSIPTAKEEGNRYDDSRNGRRLRRAYNSNIGSRSRA
jgi:cell division protein FtsW